MKESHRFFPHWHTSDTNQVIGFLNMINYIISIKPTIDNYLEIGSMIGESATMVLGFPQIKNVYCVDIWEDGNIKSIFDQRLQGQCKSIHLSSEKASQQISIPLDIVYIDGDHSYEAVSLDLSLWYPKVISGGFICGHDYDTKSWPGCKKAIDQFIQNNHLSLITFKDNSWVCRKP